MFRLSALLEGDPSDFTLTAKKRKKVPLSRVTKDSKSGKLSFYIFDLDFSYILNYTINGKCNIRLHCENHAYSFHLQLARVINSFQSLFALVFHFYFKCRRSLRHESCYCNFEKFPDLEYLVPENLKLIKTSKFQNFHCKGTA